MLLDSHLNIFCLLILTLLLVNLIVLLGTDVYFPLLKLEWMEMGKFLSCC